jgi:hypothetical protein
VDRERLAGSLSNASYWFGIASGCATLALVLLAVIWYRESVPIIIPDVFQGVAFAVLVSPAFLAVVGLVLSSVSRAVGAREGWVGGIASGVALAASVGFWAWFVASG